MMAAARHPILLLGGSGSLGSKLARTLRRMHPQLPIAIAARDADKAGLLAQELGNATVVQVDMQRKDLGLAPGAAFSAVVACLKDHGLNAMKYAQANGFAYVALSEAAFEIGPIVARYIHQPASAPVLLLGHSIGSAPMLASLHFAGEFRSVESVDIGLVFDPDDTAGAMTVADMERIGAIATAPLLLLDGSWVWQGGGAAQRRFTSVDGIERDGAAVALVDTLGIANATGARSVRLDIAEGRTASSLQGGPASHEVIIEITGERKDGGTGRFRYELVDHAGYAAMSARAIALAVERLLGLDGGAPVPAGLYLPEVLLAPEAMVRQLSAFGVRISDAGLVQALG
jgi:hypothetical protein